MTLRPGPRSIASAALLSVAAIPAASAQDWVTHHGDPALVGEAPVDLPDSLVERWRARIGDPPVGTPVGAAGTAWVLTEAGELVSVGLDGGERWRAIVCQEPGDAVLQGRFAASPLLAGELVLVGSSAGSLCALSRADGAERWRYAVQGPVLAPPNLLEPAGSSGPSVVVASQADGALHRLDLATGAALAVSEPTARSDGGVSVGEGVVAYGNCSAALCLHEAGSLALRAEVPLLADGQVFAGVALRDGHAYAGDRSGRVYAASLASGQLAWHNEEARGEIGGAPAVSTDRVVHGTSEGAVAALDRATGQTVWRVSLGGRVGAPVITAGGEVLVSAGGSLHLLRLADGAPLWSREISDTISPPAVVGELVLVGTADGFLVAFGAPPPKEHAQ